MSAHISGRWPLRTAATIVTVMATALAVTALGTGRSFTSLAPGYQQELFGSVQLGLDNAGTRLTLGGVAFAPDGDLWASECHSASTRLHRFDADALASPVNGTTTRHVSTVVPVTAGFCGLTNHPDRFLYANSRDGIYRLDAATGQLAPWFDGLTSAHGLPGNGLGITVDPVTGALVYTGANCDTAAAPSCTIHRLDPTTGTSSTFATVMADWRNTATVAFDPSGQYLFLGSRHWMGMNRVIVLQRSGDTALAIQNVPTSTRTVGLAFHATTGALVTSDEQGGMSTYAFPAGYGAGPTASSFAMGGFRSGFMSVGDDGCIHVAQGRASLATDFGTRYDNDVRTTEDSIVRICGGFAPSPGVVETGTMPGSISGSAFADWDRDGVMDAGEPGLPGVAISLTGPATSSVATDATGGYLVSDVAEGLYSVSAPATLGALTGNPTPLAVQVGSGQAVTAVDFPYIELASPTCTATVLSGTPTQVRLTLRDSDGGLRSIVVRTLTNFRLSVNGSAEVTSPGTIDLLSPSTIDVDVIATRGDEAQAASVEIEAVDMFGNAAPCGSSVAAVEPPPPPTTPPPGDAGGSTIRKELSGRGRVDVEIVHRISSDMRYVTIRNGRRGLEGVDIYVNNRRHRFWNLQDGQVESIDVARWLVKGKKNKIMLVGWGRHDRSSASVTISNQN